MPDTTTSAADTTAATTTAASAETTAAAATTSDATTQDSSDTTAQTGDAATGDAATTADAADAGDTSASADTQTADADGKAKEGEPAKPADALDFKLPEGFQADEAILGKFRGLAKDMGLDGAKAQALIDLYAEAGTALSQKMDAAHTQQVQAWGEAISKDKDLGGDNLASTRKLADAALSRFATPELRTLLNETGLGNHPDLVRVFRDIGRALSDDTVTRGSPGSGVSSPANDEQAFLDTLYPTMKKAR